MEQQMRFKSTYQKRLNMYKCIIFKLQTYASVKHFNYHYFLHPSFKKQQRDKTIKKNTCYVITV